MSQNGNLPQIGHPFSGANLLSVSGRLYDQRCTKKTPIFPRIPPVTMLDRLVSEVSQSHLKNTTAQVPSLLLRVFFFRFFFPLLPPTFSVQSVRCEEEIHDLVGSMKVSKGNEKTRRLCWSFQVGDRADPYKMETPYKMALQMGNWGYFTSRSGVKMWS